MKLRLTIDIFSGRPNPYQIIEGNEAKKMLNKIKLNAALRNNARQSEPENLGYRGIIVENLDGAKTDFPEYFRITPDRLFAGAQNADASSDQFETGILDGLAKFKGIGNKKEFKNLLIAEMTNLRNSDAILSDLVIPPILIPRPNPCQCAPDPDLAWWNDGSTRQFGNNCYNYATNYRTDTFAQPGKAAGQQYTSLSGCAVAAGQRSALDGAIADCLINTPAANNKCPQKGHLVALVIAPGFDFHWYRKGNNGRWSHKPGGTPAKLTDNSGNIITDPRTANRGMYTQFCTFMQVKHGHIKIK